MTPAEKLLDFLDPQLGQEIHVGPWLQIDQERINKFAEVTGDLQWIHTDPERSATDSPYGSTVAHGYLTLSLLPYLTESNHPNFFQKNYPVFFKSLFPVISGTPENLLYLMERKII